MGNVHASKPSTGTRRAASLPRTISESVRSVTRRWVREPRARSRQMAPAVAAGAARRTRVSWVPTTAK